jgi:hypothetical protein
VIEYLDSSRGKSISQLVKEQKIRGAEAAGASVFNLSSNNFSVDIDDDLDNDRNDTWGDEHEYEHDHAQPLPPTTTSASRASAEPPHDHHTSVSEPFPLPADGNIFTATSCGYASGRSHVCGNTTHSEAVVFSSDEQ